MSEESQRIIVEEVSCSWFCALIKPYLQANVAITFRLISVTFAFAFINFLC